jgi:hypothetical protein
MSAHLVVLSGMFWALNIVFFFCSPQSDYRRSESLTTECVVLLKTFPTGYHASKMEVVCKSYDPRKLTYQITPTTHRAHMNFDVSPSRVRFLDV